MFGKKYLWQAIKEALKKIYISIIKTKSENINKLLTTIKIYRKIKRIEKELELKNQESWYVILRINTKRKEEEEVSMFLPHPTI